MTYTLAMDNFRCYHHRRHQWRSPVTMLHGPNGSGKTSWLEALSLLIPGRGLRSCSSEQWHQHHSSDPWRIQLGWDHPTGAVHIETRLSEQRRRFWVNGVLLKNQHEIRQWLTVTWPMHLPHDTPSLRRAYWNRLVYTLDPDYGPLWMHHDKALKQRNALLAQDSHHDLWFDSIESELARLATAIHIKRQEAVEKIHAALANHATPFPAPTCVLSGSTETALEQDPSGNHYRQLLRHGRATDRIKKSTSIGMHKTTVQWFHPNGQEWGVCSTGEQKSITVSLALAVCRAAWNPTTDRQHLFLLDEGLVHLDTERQQWLWEELYHLPYQCLISGNHPPSFVPLSSEALVLWTPHKDHKTTDAAVALAPPLIHPR